MSGAVTPPVERSGKPPQTWQQGIEQGARLTKAPDKYAYIFPINNFLKTLDQVWMNGGDVVDRTYLPTKATFTAPKVGMVPLAIITERCTVS